jgi:hypothetical protein
MIVPLAVSYNTRGIEGAANALTNSVDQRKINCIYEPIKNAVSGQATLYLAKRPGTQIENGQFGTSSHRAYLWDIGAGATDPDSDSQRWVFSTSTNSVLVSNSAFTNAVTTNSGSFAPGYVDRTLVSGVDTVVLQLKSTSAGGLQTVWHSSTISTFTQITSATLTSLAVQGKMEHLNGYALISTLDSVVNSDLNTLDVWSASGAIKKSIKQDIGTGLAKLGPQIISFGTASMEVFRNVGNAFGSPLESVPTLAKDYGLASTNVSFQRHYYAVLDGWLYWRGANGAKYNGVFAYDGQRVEKVSAPAIDKILGDLNTYFYVSAISFGGRKAIAIGIDSVSQSTQRALLFFPEWNDWFEWNSTVFMPVSSPRYDSVCIGVSSLSHRLLRIESQNSDWRDNGVHYTMSLQFKLPNNGNAHRRLHSFGVKGDTAASTTTSVLNVRFSTDDWQTSTTAREIDMTKSQKRITRCGGYNDLGVYLDHTANLDCRLEAVLARVE